ncbi:MAG: FAD-dependent oxidoreductase [Proteobacteria bacterium]|nr:FAD-dependent oxidoreductase [Pseudomonadota bacterium]
MEKVDVVIVGGGLAGLSCAWSLAGGELTVLVLERGDFSGSKNVTGGRIYLGPIRRFMPELWEQAPFERHVTKEALTLMAGSSSTTFTLSSQKMNQSPYPSYTILRSTFDRWFADKVMQKGAYVVPEKRVDGLLMEDGRVVGVVTGDEEIAADVVVAADGVLSFLAENAGLRKPFEPHHFAVGLKEVIQLPREKIEDRFGLRGDEGMARLFVGSLTKGMMGGGFLYTNRESLSLGMVIGIDAINNREPREEVYQFLDDFKESSEITKLIEGGSLVEYSAHVIPEGGINFIPRLYSDGILVVGDAAGFGLNILITVRGMEYAIASGALAAEAIKNASNKGDFSSRSLASYEDLLRKSFLLKELHTFRHALSILKNPRWFNHYPQAICDLYEKLIWVDENPKSKLSPTAYRELRKNILNVKGMMDILSLRRI